MKEWMQALYEIKRKERKKAKDGILGILMHASLAEKEGPVKGTEKLPLRKEKDEPAWA